MNEDYSFWKMANYLIEAKKYRLVQASPSKHELWLEKRESKEWPLVRLLRYDFDWSYTLKQDIEVTSRNAESLRKQMGRKEFQALNVYFSAFPPVDDYQYILDQSTQTTSATKTTVKTVLITRERSTIDLPALLATLGGGDLPIRNDVTPEEVQQLQNQTLTLAYQEQQKEKAIFSYGKPFFTYVFMAVQVLMFMLLEFNGGSTNTSTLIQFGAKFNPLILEGEWWRFFTPILLHIGFLHLFMNTLALYYLGPTIERIFGRARFFIIYLVAGFCGSLASFLFSSSLSAGASGAIFGCFGALLYFGVTYRSLFLRTMGLNVFVVIAINLSLGFTVPGIDNAGHIGGLLGGFLASGIVHFPKQKSFRKQVSFLLATLSIIVGMLWYGFTHQEQIVDEQAILTLADVYIQEEKFKDAKETLLAATQYKQDSENIYFQLSYVEIKLDELDQAEIHLLKVIELDPSTHEAFYNLSLLSLEKGDISQATQYLVNATKLAPNQKEYSELLNQIKQQQ